MKVGIITKIDNNNYGNRLQNYALYTYIRKKYAVNVEVISNISQLNNISDSKIKNLAKRLKYVYFPWLFNKNSKRKINFLNFNKNMNFSKKVYDNYHPLKNNDYNKTIIGSDQVWNYKFDMPDLFFGIGMNKKNNYSYSASVGVSTIPNEKRKYYQTRLENIHYISVREDRGKEIIEELTGRNDIEVLIDPTMLLTSEEWDKVSKKPKMLNKNKYILNYFLGSLSEDREKEISRVAIENNCEIINILDINSPFYECGPSEFLWLEKNAFLICTDSFHSSVFAILYNRPFIIFDREQKEMVNMNSRIDTLINTFKLKNRKYNGTNITKENLKNDYSESYKILERERKKSKYFLEKVLEIKEGDYYDR